MISSKPYSVPLIDILILFPKLWMFPKNKDLEMEVQQDLSLKLSSFGSLIDPFNDTDASNLAAKGRFFFSTK